MGRSRSFNRRNAPTASPSPSPRRARGSPPLRTPPPSSQPGPGSSRPSVFPRSGGRFRRAQEEGCVPAGWLPATPGDPTAAHVRAGDRHRPPLPFPGTAKDEALLRGRGVFQEGAGHGHGPAEGAGRRGRARGLRSRRDPHEDVPSHLLRRRAPAPRPRGAKPGAAYREGTEGNRWPRPRARARIRLALII